MQAWAWHQRRQPLHELGKHFAEVWNSDACAMTLKKRIARTLIHEIVVDIDAAQQLNMVIHWHGGCHTSFSMKKPIVKYLKFTREFNAAFPGFDTDVHGLVEDEGSGGTRRCYGDCVRDWLRPF